MLVNAGGMGCFPPLQQGHPIMSTDAQQPACTPNPSLELDCPHFLQTSCILPDATQSLDTEVPGHMSPLD